MKSRRPCLAQCGVSSSTNAGLWLHKYLTDQTEPEGDTTDAAKAAKVRLWMDVSENIQCPPGYRTFLERWQRALGSDSGGQSDIARLDGRMVIGLGAKGALEAGLHLDFTWGVPVLPGSSLKGLAAATARKLAQDPSWRVDGDSYRTLFGTTDESGAVDFLDAWWVPSPDKTALPVQLDVMAVHHKKYYEDKQADALDTDEPVPVPFGTVASPDGPVEFLVAVSGPRAWRQAALDLLSLGLRELGLGAKTHAGYGRLRLGAEPARSATASDDSTSGAGAASGGVAPRGPSVDRLISDLGANNAGQLVPGALEALEGAALEDFVTRAVAKIGSKKVREKAKAGKPWAQKLQRLHEQAK